MSHLVSGHVKSTLDTPGRTLSAHAQLALIAVSTRECRVARRDHAHELAREVEVETLAEYVLKQRIGLIATQRLGELGLPRLAHALEARVSARREHALAGAKAQCVLTDGIRRRLEEVGVPALTLKGVDLSDRLYGDGAARESNDVDILVAAEHLDRALEVAQHEFGYAAPVDALGPDGRPLLHYRLPHPNGWPDLEIHWRVHWYESRSGVAMLGESTRGPGRREMSPRHEFACLLLFYARNAFLGVRDLAAIAAWWDLRSDSLPTGALASFLAQFPELASAAATAARIASVLAGVPLAALELDVPEASVRERQAARLADPEPELDQSGVLAHIALVDLLLSPGLELRSFIGRQLLLDASYQEALTAAGRGGALARRGPVLSRIFGRAARMAGVLVKARPLRIETG